MQRNCQIHLHIPTTKRRKLANIADPMLWEIYR
jgi:hypothetical protein